MKNGKSDESDCGALEHDVINLYNQIGGKVNADLDILLGESDIDAILKGESNEYGGDVERIVFDAAQMCINDLFGKLRERAIDLYCKVCNTPNLLQRLPSKFFFVIP